MITKINDDFMCELVSSLEPFQKAMKALERITMRTNRLELPTLIGLKKDCKYGSWEVQVANRK